MSSEFRVRTRGGYTSLYPTEVFIRKGAASSSTTRTIANANGTYETMRDYVTRPFVPGKTVVNSPMERITTTRSTTTQTGSQDLHYSTNCGVSDTTVIRVEGERLFGPFDSIWDVALSKLSQADQAVISLACTQALSRVQAPEVSSLVSLMEIKDTVHSLLNPVQGALNWLKRNAPTKRRARRFSKRGLTKREIALSAKDLTNQHLTIIFGLMPFISDIQGILKALEAIEPLPVRQTARGNASYMDESTESTYFQTYGDSKTQSHATQDISVQKVVTVRAYQLYESKVSLASALGLSLSDIPKSVWQAATLSFVVDWFANVGEFISALTPRSDVTYLASGYTIDTVTACKANYLDEVHAAPGVTDCYWSGRWSGSAQRVVVAKRRVPSGLFGHVGLHMKSNVHKDVLDTFKITAGISLITQRLVQLK